MKKNVYNIFNEYTSTSSYWAGLLAADGRLDVNGTIGLELSDKDSYLIEQFKQDVNSEHAIYYREATNAYSIRFSDADIQNSLKYNFSVSADKTFNLQMPLLPEQMYPHYLRGIFDGDGCLTEFFNNRPTASFRVYQTSGSYEFLFQLLEFLQTNNICVGGSIQKKAANCWHLQLAIKDSSGFLNYIYLNNNISNHRYMVRKYDKYRKIIVENNRDKIKV